MTDANSNSLIEGLFKNVIGPFSATLIAPLLIEPDHVDDRVVLLKNTFDSNPHLIPAFQKLIHSMNPKEVEVPLEENIRFFTTKHTRYWLIVNLMNAVLNIKELKLDDTTGRLPNKPSELIKCASDTEKTFEEDGRYKDLLFSAALMFDFIIYLQKTAFLNLGGAKFDEGIKQLFVSATDQAKFLMRLCKHKPKLSLERFVPVIPYMRNLAQACIMLLQPGKGPEFYKKLVGLKHTESVRLALEMNAFGGVNSAMVASYLAQSVPAFEQLGEGLAVWSAPYLAWQSGMRDVHDMSATGLLGIALRERVKGAEFQGDGKVSVVIPELYYLDFYLTPRIKGEIKI